MAVFTVRSVIAAVTLYCFSGAPMAQDAAPADAPKFYRTPQTGQPYGTTTQGQGQGGEYFDSRSMRWFTANGQPCTYCTEQNGFLVPLDQISQNQDLNRYTFPDGFFFSPYELAWFDRAGECLRCDPSTGFWIPDAFAESAEYRKERRRFQNLMSGPGAPQPDGRPANAPRAGFNQGGGFGQVAGLPARFDARQLRWVDTAGQICAACTPENGYWIPPQFANEPEFRLEQQRYTALIGSMRREVPQAPQQPQTLECSSKDNRYTLCRIDTARGVAMERQLSRSICTQNQTWGFTREGIWVDRGCRARFIINR
jgi:Protein of unknown function (DUF3011)